MYISRLLEQPLQVAVDFFPAVFVGGPRRSGKTTLVRHLCRNHRYVLLDDLDIRKFAAEDPRGFLEQHAPPVIIDEIQNVPELLNYIKARIDANKRPGQWILTGSQQWALMRGISETLAGRIAILHLYPFALSEINRSPVPQPAGFEAYVRHLQREAVPAEKKCSVGDWIIGGGYPEVRSGGQATRKLWFSSYMQTYIDRDVRGNVKEGNLRDFERFIGLLAARTAQQLNTADLARDVGVSIPTIKSWLTLMETSGLIFFLPPYFNNYGKRLIKSPKCYFLDTGLACYLTGLQQAEHALQGPMAGALFETACVNQLYKRLSVWGDERSLYYFRSTDGLEVDMLIDRGGRLFAFEVKLSATVDSSRIRAIASWRKLDTGADTMVISTAARIGEIATGVRNVPYYLL